MRAKGSLQARNIPFDEVDLLLFPERRSDMVSLADRCSVPQIFFNEEHIGGADDLHLLLKEWEKDKTTSPFGIFLRKVKDLPDPTDERLSVPSQEAVSRRYSSSASALDLNQGDVVQLPDGKMTSVLKVVLELDKILDSQDRAYNAHLYKKCFVNGEAVTAIQEHFDLSTREEAVNFAKYLQKEHSILHHVCEDHEFRDDGYYFFRLQRYHQPDVLNSFCVWKDDPPELGHTNALVMKLKKMLFNILNRYTDSNGLVDYLKSREDASFAKFEYAASQLQVLDISELGESERMTFGLNLYNLFISYAFVKMGISTTTMGRGAFFSRIRMNLGGHLLSFNDLEHGVLRANTKHPYATKKNFSEDDPRRQLALSKLDPRVHFALNCGARSCPPVKFFHPESLEEELRIVAMSFCEKDEAVLIDESKGEITVSMLLKWYGKDFCASKDKLPEALLPYLKGEKKEKLARLIRDKEHRPISIKFQKYDWSANASNFEPYTTRKMSANMFTPLSLLVRNSCF